MMRKKIRLIGFYDYTVILTYMSLVSAVYGMTQAIHGDYKAAIFCLAFSGICDAFDGKVARSKKDRTAEGKAFGIQLDSLCDVVSFGVFPALICYLMGVRGTLGLIIVFFYCLCAVIRLAYFNVLEEKRQKTEDGGNKVYHGLPVTSMSFILPLMFWLQFVIPDKAFMVILHLLLAVVGFLFVLDFPMRKPNFKQVIVMAVFLMVTVGAIYGYSRYHLPNQYDESNPIVEEILGEIYDD